VNYFEKFVRRGITSFFLVAIEFHLKTHLDNWYLKRWSVATPLLYGAMSSHREVIVSLYERHSFPRRGSLPSQPLFVRGSHPLWGDVAPHKRGAAIPHLVRNNPFVIWGGRPPLSLSKKNHLGYIFTLK
jgi:hypothetical protein